MEEPRAFDLSGLPHARKGQRRRSHSCPALCRFPVCHCVEARAPTQADDHGLSSCRARVNRRTPSGCAGGASLDAHRVWGSKAKGKELLLRLNLIEIGPTFWNIESVR
jgi:hypothetical protein